MRCNWQRWLWGLIPLVMVSWVAVQVERDRIQEDLAGRANAALAASGSRWAGVEVDGRDLVLTGRALEDNEPPGAERTLRKLWGVRVVDNRAIVPQKVEPYVWAARRRGNRIRLSGYVPDRTTRRTVLGLTKAAMPELDVDDRMHSARGVPSPDTWLAGLSFALKQLSLLKKGEARFDNLALAIFGEADSPAAFKTVTTALKSGLPNGITLSSSEIAAPVVSPFTWSARFAGGQLVMAGHVAGGEKTRADLMAAASAAAPALNTVDRMEQAEGAPKGWADVAMALMRELVRLENGTVEMKDAALTIGGVAPDEPQAQAIRAALRASVPPAFSLVDRIRVREVKAPEPAPVAPPPAPLKQTELAPPARDTVSSESAAAPASKSPVENAPVQVAPAPGPQVEAPSKMAAVPAPEPQAEPPVAQVAPVPQPAAEPKQAAPAPPPAALPEPEKQAAPAPQPPARTESKEAASAPLPTPEVKPTPKAAPAPPPPAQAESKEAASAPPLEVRPAPKVATAPPAAPAPPPEVTACQANLNKITNAGHINFASDSAALDSASFATLDLLAAAARACPAMRIAIEGHTDAEGSAGYNQRLSVRRARAVVAYLVKAGADRTQLEAVGYGRSRPAAPNDTEENMAKNRRIEFSVRQK